MEDKHADKKKRRTGAKHNERERERGREGEGERDREREIYYNKRYAAFSAHWSFCFRLQKVLPTVQRS
jgi:hypothetical protein